MNDQHQNRYSGQPGPMTRQRRSGGLRVVEPGRRFSLAEIIREEIRTAKRWRRMQRCVERRGRQIQALTELAIIDTERRALLYQLGQVDRRRRRVLDDLATIPGGEPCKK